jgi:chromosome segregation ATPase
MKIIYAEKSTGINEDASFQNPKYFERAESRATFVVIYGDYPEIKAAYEVLGLEVEVREVVKKPSKANDELEKLQSENTDLISDLKTALDAKDQLQAKLTETEGQLSAVQAENTDLKAKVAELEKAAVKKPTAAELKAAKAEEAKAAEQSQE